MKNYKKYAFEFVDYAILNQQQLKDTLRIQLTNYGYKVKNKDGFLFARGNVPIMLVAHLDTVHKSLPKNIWYSFNYNKITSDEGIGGDDRCGVYIIMKTLERLNVKPSILFVEDEEIGGVGSNKFIKRYNDTNLDLDYIIEIDRKGNNDSVYYDLDNVEFENFINTFGFKTACGSFTDICNLCPVLKCAGVNFSSGYYNPHTSSEYVVVSEMLTIIDRLTKILKDYENKDFRNKFEWVEMKYTYSYYGYNYGKYWLDKYNKENETKTLTPITKDNNPYYVDPDYYTYNDYCYYCGKYTTGKYTEDDYEFICDECAKRFGLKECCECDRWGWELHDGLCQECHMEEQYRVKKELEKGEM